MALHKLSEYFYRYYGKMVIILLDEYDTPIQEAYLNGYWDEMTGFVRSMFNAAFKTNPYLERAIMTGITGVGKLIREGSANVKIVMEDLLNGKSLHTQIDEQIVFSQLNHNEYAIWSLLLAGGYLRVEKYVLDEESGKEEYELALTNKEAHIVFERLIQEWFARFTPSYNAFIKALLQGDLKAMNAYMNKVALATFSYFDTAKKPSEESEPERFYHGFAFKGKKVLIGS